MATQLAFFFPTHMYILHIYSDFLTPLATHEHWATTEYMGILLAAYKYMPVPSVPVYSIFNLT